MAGTKEWKNNQLARERIVQAAQGLRVWRLKANRLKLDRSLVLCKCEKKTDDRKPCPMFYGKDARSMWCDTCLTTAEIHKAYREAANKATAWQRSLNHWCDKVSGDQK